MWELTIEVTQEDIAFGIPTHATKCPIANAIKRYLRNGCLKLDVVLGPSVSIETSPYFYLWGRIGGIGRKMFRSFDRGEKIEPSTTTF